MDGVGQARWVVDELSRCLHDGGTLYIPGVVHITIFHYLMMNDRYQNQDDIKVKKVLIFLDPSLPP